MLPHIIPPLLGTHPSLRELPDTRLLFQVPISTFPPFLVLPNTLPLLQVPPNIPLLLWVLPQTLPPPSGTPPHPPAAPTPAGTQNVTNPLRVPGPKYPLPAPPPRGLGYHSLPRPFKPFHASSFLLACPPGEPSFPRHPLFPTCSLPSLQSFIPSHPFLTLLDPTHSYPRVFRVRALFTPPPPRVSPSITISKLASLYHP